MVQMVIFSKTSIGKYTDEIVPSIMMLHTLESRNGSKCNLMDEIDFIEKMIKPME